MTHKKQEQVPVLLVLEDEEKQSNAQTDLALQQYLDEIGQIPLLTAEQELALAEQMAKGDQGAQQLLIKANLRLVVALAKCYRNERISLLDLIQEGNVGLMCAAERFDYTRGFRFSTYAAWWIRRALSRAVAELPRTIHLPVHVAELINKLKRIARWLAQDLGREPLAAEISRVAKLPEESVIELLSLDAPLLSLDAPLSNDHDEPLADLLEDTQAVTPTRVVTNLALREQLAGALDVLSERERQIIELRHGLLWTLEEIGVELHLSRERIRQIEVQAMHKLRTHCQQETNGERLPVRGRGG